MGAPVQSIQYFPDQISACVAPPSGRMLTRIEASLAAHRSRMPSAKVNSPLVCSVSRSRQYTVCPMLYHTARGVKAAWGPQSSSCEEVASLRFITKSERAAPPASCPLSAAAPSRETARCIPATGSCYCNRRGSAQRHARRPRSDPRRTRRSSFRCQ